ncbi:MAG: holo-ACP synthase [Peptococcaceae bacterium]|jgi:holo-[acyl-carrier protein] synthase|nr:holo-ACP synthase [Peptococcaceae bacterium]
MTRNIEGKFLSFLVGGVPLFYKEKQANSIIGVGTDIIEIDRIRQAIERSGNRFLERVFTPAEIAYCEAGRDRFPGYAARFAAKEAVLKVMGSGLQHCRWVDVEVRRGTDGPPEVMLHGNAAELARARGIREWYLSVSHSKKNAVAFAIATGRRGNV